MSKNETSEQESGESIDEKRAQYERMQFTVCANGYVNVCNESHNDDTNHTYSVEVTDGEAVDCSCPHHVHRGVTCKHMIAVSNSPIVLSSASATGATREVVTDGGETITDDDGDERPAQSEKPDMGGGESSGVDEL